MPEKIEKVWGFEEIWINEPEYCFKILVLKPGFTSSKHYHQKKKETFLVLRGHCRLELWITDAMNNQSLCLTELKSEMQITIEPGQPHRFSLESEAGEPCVIYEISTHHSDKDVVRQSESRRLV
jgi:mannose-6-phosphate isomerase-like protein (cupin superfamily)